MRKLLCSFIFYFALVVGVNAQCVVPAGFVCITQEDANRTSAALAELKESRTVIADFKAERILTASQAKAADNLITFLDILVARQNKVIVDYDKLFEAAQKVFDAQMVFIEKLTTALNKKPSKWQQVLAVIKRIGDIAVGIAIGRVF